MRFSVKVKPNSKEARVEKIAQNQLALWVKAPPQEGRANKAVVEVLSEYLLIPKSRIRIVKGQKVRNKIVEII